MSGGAFFSDGTPLSFDGHRIILDGGDGPTVISGRQRRSTQITGFFGGLVPDLEEERRKNAEAMRRARDRRRANRHR